MKRFFFAMAMMLAVAASMAAPVKNMPVKRIQPKGDTLYCLVSGDEFYHRLHDAEDYTIIQNVETGWYVYAAYENGVLVPTQYVPGQVNPASVGLKPHLMPCADELRKMHDRWNIPEKYQTAAPKTSGYNHGALNNIVIFIRFSDESSCTSASFSTISDKFNDSTIGAVSMYNYFKVDSYRKLYVPTYFYPAPSGNTVMSYQDSHPRAYYEPYSSTNTTGYSDDDERTSREFTLLQNAVNWVNANSPVPTSLNLDIDNDGRVDNVCFVVSGTNNGWNDMLWPHKWSLYDRTVNINGKRVYTFNFQLAGSGEHYFGVSTLCHEMTHTLGCPDLYHYYDYDEVSPAGSWDLMHSNATPPQQTNSLFKYKYLNWFDSIPELTEAGTYTMQSLAKGPNHAYKIASPNPDQWYILEYRNNTDTFDSSIPGRGMLIWRYNNSYYADNANFDNTDTPHELWLFRPNSSNDITNGTIASAAFGVNGRTSFGPTTNPHPYMCNGQADTSFSITNIAISSDNQSVSFTFTPNQTTCGAVTRFPHIQDFENAGLDCWSFVSADPANDSRTGVISSEHNTGSYAFAFSSWSQASDYNQYLISPELSTTDSLMLTFYYKRYSGRAETFSVKYSTTTDAITAFTNTVFSTTATVDGWQLCSVMLPPTAKYVCINYSSNYLYYLYIDDITLVKPCGTIRQFPHSEGFEAGELGCWDFVSADPSNDSRVGVLQTGTASNFTSHAGDYAFRFSSYDNATDYNQYLISPRIQASEPLQLSFYYKRSHSSTENFRVRYSTTTGDTASFTNTLGDVAVTTSTWQQFTATLPANTQYVAINYYSYYKYYLDIDDITLVGTTTHDTTYIYVHDTLTRNVHDTLTLWEHDTLGYTLHDTITTTVHDTALYAVRDTMVNIIYDTNVVIPARYSVQVRSNEPARGAAIGTGTYPEGSEVQITGLAKRGYRFDHWQDGNTDNPRTITIEGNKIFSASFVSVGQDKALRNTVVHDTVVVRDTTWIDVHDTTWMTFRDTTWIPTGRDTTFITLHDTIWLPNPIHDTVWVDQHQPLDVDTTTFFTLTITANYDEAGQAYGSGRYPRGSVVEIGAVTREQGCIFGFFHVVDGNENDLSMMDDFESDTHMGLARVVMNSDMTVVAEFLPIDDIEQPETQSGAKIYTQGSTLVVESEAMGCVSVFNALGQQVYSQNTQRAVLTTLPAGIYMVRVADAPARKVVIVR